MIEPLTPKQMKHLNRSIRAYAGDDCPAVRHVHSTRISDILILDLEVTADNGSARHCHAVIANRSARPVLKEGFFGRAGPLEGGRAA